MNDQPTVPKQPQTFSERFVERLRKLPRADKAILKRNAGQALAHARQAYAVFYRLYLAGDIQPDNWQQRDEEAFFLAATLFGLNPDPESEQQGHKKHPASDFGGTMKMLVTQGLSQQSAEKRMTALLDCPFDLGQERSELAYRLRQCTKLAASKDILMNWPQLLYDLQHWNHPDKYVQKRWARSFFRQTSVPPQNNPHSQDNDAHSAIPAATA